MPRTSTIDPGPAIRSGPARGLTAAAGVTSLAVAALSLFFLVRPEMNEFVPEVGVLGTHLMPAGALTAGLLAVGLLGAVTSALALNSRRLPGPVTTAVGVLTAVSFGVLAQGTGTLSTFGYLVAFTVPVVLVVIGVQIFRAFPGARVPMLVVAAAAVVGIVAARDPLADYLTMMGPGLVAERFTIAAVVLPLLAAVAWAAVLVTGAQRSGRLARATAWVTRHRRMFTVLAALGPLPYAMIRLTWLTPWPQFGGPLAEIDPMVRLQGLLLGSAGWLGFVLTLGLILPWGERIPRWFPGRTGRPVPPPAAIIPGGLIALMLCGAAVPMLELMGLQGAVLFPAWFWGPMLALAVWGYAGHRGSVLERVGTAV